MLQNKMLFNCSPDNDLYKILCKAGHKFPRYDTFNEFL